MRWPSAADSLLVVGSLNMDLVGRAEHVPAPGETVSGGDLVLFHGGKGGNQATAAVRMGVPVAMAGAVGDDAHGLALAAGLRAEGIDLSRLRTVAGASGAALITVANDGENAITVLPGANRLAPLPSADDRMSGVGAVLLQLELPIATVEAWALHAHGLGLPVMLNAAPATALPDTLWATLDTVLVNRDELSLLSGTRDLPAGLQALRERGLRCAVVTLGALGCCASFDGCVLELPAVVVPVVDTTGAGDTFAGVFAAARVRGLGVVEALGRANAAAALSCAQTGARSGMPTAAAVAAFARQNAGLRPAPAIAAPAPSPAPRSDPG